MDGYSLLSPYCGQALWRSVFCIIKGENFKANEEMGKNTQHMTEKMILYKQFSQINKNQ